MGQPEEDEKKCIDKVEGSFIGRMEDIRILWEADKRGLDYVSDLDPDDPAEIADFLDEAGVDIEPDDFDKDDYGCFSEYGLAFDYVAPGTFGDQEQAYFRYQISWGGPSEEFRFYCNPDLSCYRVEFWYLDWFDGAPIHVQGDDLIIIQEVFEMFRECGTCQHLIDQKNEG